jgi:hypothetical protein
MMGALVQQQNKNLRTFQHAIDGRKEREEGEIDRVVWVRQWILRRREHGLYD